MNYDIGSLLFTFCRLYSSYLFQVQEEITPPAPSGSETPTKKKKKKNKQTGKDNDTNSDSEAKVCVCIEKDDKSPLILLACMQR